MTESEIEEVKAQVATIVKGVTASVGQLVHPLSHSFATATPLSAELVGEAHKLHAPQVNKSFTSYVNWVNIILGCFLSEKFCSNCKELKGNDPSSSHSYVRYCSDFMQCGNCTHLLFSCCQEFSQHYVKFPVGYTRGRFQAKRHSCQVLNAYIFCVVYPYHPPCRENVYKYNAQLVPSLILMDALGRGSPGEPDVDILELGMHITVTLT